MLDAGSLERVERILDVLGVLILEVVVPDRDDHIRSELRAQRLRELHDARRAHAVDRAALPFDATARRDLQVEVLADAPRGDPQALADRVGRFRCRGLLFLQVKPHTGQGRPVELHWRNFHRGPRQAEISREGERSGADRQLDSLES